MAIAPQRAEIGIRRHFTTEGVHPYDEVRWERRDARITNFRDGTVAFEQLGVEVPESWSVNATNILAQKYFRGTLGTAEREWSLKQVADRVVDTLTSWGIKDGYFVDDDEALTFNHELKYLVIHQRAAFNSPVWFNIGVAGVPQQGSACFILSVEDTMDSILNWYTEEGVIFKGGSGAGVNLSRIRSSHELLKGGGTASGPVSFMRGADASAGTIKSGGKTRRAAKMVILDADHPDVEDFIWCKAIEERKARVLRDAGFDMDLDGTDSHSTQYQNANNSVRVTDEFMEAVIDGRDWNLTARTDGSVVRTVPARDLFRQIAHSAWECADPGLQYDTTINRWHTAPNAGRITGSNPCFPGSAKVHTDKGLVPFRELFERANKGETFGIYTHDATNPDEPSEQMLITSPEAFMITGFNDIVRLRFDNGAELRCTPSHKIFTTNRGYVEARKLVFTDEVKLLDLEAPPVDADLVLPVSSDPADYWTKGDHDLPLAFPETWSEEFAHYLGWLVGDGSTSGNTVAAIYGSQEDRDEILPRHAELLDWVNCGRPIKLSEQANGTAQLRLARRAFKRFIEALGVKPVKGPEKTVPWSVERAPAEIAAAFLRGLYDADGCVVDSSQRYVGLGSTSPELLKGVQTLLSTFGIMSRIYQTKRAGKEGGFTYTDKNGTTKRYGHSAMYDLRITSSSIVDFAQHIGFSLTRKAAALLSLVVDAPRAPYLARRTAHILERVNDGHELTYNLSEPRNHSYVVNGVVVRNCSEYVHLENSACNLASLNLLTFLDANDDFDVEGFKAAVSVVFTGQEIIVGNADYPTDKIGETTRAFRELGIGYANLGALLMAEGLPYDSDAGRAWAAAITALLTGHAYATSARTAARMGPFAGFHENSEPMLNVLRMHQAEAARIDEDVVPPELLSAAQESWDQAVELAELYGVRNSQSSVLAPTGTIGLLMDCDTTGVEPDLGLVKTKKLVGGGTMSIVNQTVPRALTKLGYGPDQVDEIIAYVNEHMSIVGAPHLAPEHMAVFACSMGDNTIHYSGHIRMMGAVQPFISGAISKCVTGETLIPTEDGLVRMGSFYEGEEPDSFRPETILVSSLDGQQKTDAFYYGGQRAARNVTLRSGHRITGTPNHRLLVAGDEGPEWKMLAEIEPGDEVAVQYGAECWASVPPRIVFRPDAPYGKQRLVRIPTEMSEDLAFLLGAYASEGHTARSVWSIKVTNSVDEVLERIARAAKRVFGVNARIRHYAERCGYVEINSKTVVELFEHLGCGSRASEKRIPDIILRSPRAYVLAFLQGLALDAYTASGAMTKWAICLDAPALLDDLQAVLTNLGVVHGRVTKLNRLNGKSYDEVYASGPHAQRMIRLVPFLEPDKATAAERLLDWEHAHSTADIVPGVSGRDLYGRIPKGRRARFGYLLDHRTKNVSRYTLERLAAMDGVELTPWLRTILRDGLHFSPVVEATDAGVREVYDLSVPATHAFVGNGIMNHNTVNMPEDVTVEEVEQLHVDAWRLGLKAVAIYRDNCKVAQPLSTTKKEREVVEGGDSAPAGSDAEAKDREIAARIAQLETALAHERERASQPVVVGAVRERLPRKRNSKTFSFRVADCEGYVTIGEYEDGRPGEVFIKVSKQGSTLAGIMDAFSIAISLGLQHQVPLATFVTKYANMKFEPAGITDDPELRIASSLLDYIFRRVALDYLTQEERTDLGILSTQERTQPTLPGVEEMATPSVGLVDDGPAGGIGSANTSGQPATTAPVSPAAGATAGSGQPLARSEQRDAPFCYNCGNVMQRAGSCYVCGSCGSTSGCS